MYGLFIFVIIDGFRTPHSHERIILIGNSNTNTWLYVNSGVQLCPIGTFPIMCETVKIDHWYFKWRVYILMKMSTRLLWRHEFDSTFQPFPFHWAENISRKKYSGNTNWNQLFEDSTGTWLKQSQLFQPPAKIELKMRTQDDLRADWENSGGKVDSFHVFFLKILFHSLSVKVQEQYRFQFRNS